MKISELKQIIRSIVREEISDALMDMRSVENNSPRPNPQTRKSPVKNTPTIKTGNPELDKIFSTTSPLNETPAYPVGLSESMGVVGGEMTVPSTFSGTGDPIPDFLMRDFKGILKESVKKSRSKHGPL